MAYVSGAVSWEPGLSTCPIAVPLFGAKGVPIQTSRRSRSYFVISYVAGREPTSWRDAGRPTPLLPIWHSRFGHDALGKVFRGTPENRREMTED